MECMSNRDVAIASQILATPFTLIIFVLFGVFIANNIEFFQQWQTETIVLFIIVGLGFVFVEFYVIFRNFKKMENHDKFTEKNYKREIREMVLRVFGEDKKSDERPKKTEDN